MKVNKRNSPLFAIGEEKWQAFKASYSGNYDLSKSVYAGMNNKISFVCPLHGDMQMDAKNLMNGKMCLKCAILKRANSIRLTQNTYIARVIEQHNDTYDYANTVYTGLKNRVTIRCLEHGDFEQLAGDHLNGSGCPKCASLSRASRLRDTLESFKIKLSDVFTDFDVISTDYVNSQTPIKVFCKTHKKKVTTKPNWILSGNNPCTQCNHMRSSQEDAIAEFIAQHTLVERRNRSILGTKEIDIWLPEHNMGIEYHGLYYHSGDNVGKLHREKWELAEKAGIRLIQIFEDEWATKQNLIKARLLAFIGEGKTYNARQLTVKKVPMKDIRLLLESTHIQGAGASSVNYALYDGDSPVAAATFGKARSGAMLRASNNSAWEVVRYASIGRVRGGFSKLYSQFLLDVNPDKVISYCDLRYGNGKLYEVNGFILEGITEPDYWWVPRGKSIRVPRYETQKHKLASPAHPLNAYYSDDKSESEICKSAGWKKIFGVGNQKWVWSK